jgi:hypothetical protein
LAEITTMIFSIMSVQNFPKCHPSVGSQNLQTL